MAKVFESIVTSRLSDFLLSFADSQDGFFKGRSVLSNLLIYNDFIFDIFKSRSQVDSVWMLALGKTCLDGLGLTLLADPSQLERVVPSLTHFNLPQECLKAQI